VRSATRIDRDSVLEALRATAVLDYFGVKGRRCGREFRTRTCPACGERSRADTVAVNVETGHWRDHAHGCSGDILALLAGLGELNVRTQFPQVLELAAQIAGVEPENTAPVERAQRRAAAERRTAERIAEQVAEDEQRRLAAIARATPQWGRMQTSSDAGEAYLRTRDVGKVAGSGVVRFDDAGNVVVALHTADGQIVNVVRRSISNAEPKILGLKGCPTAGTFIDSIDDITCGRDVVLVEGLFDALTARLAWPDAVVLGAHGASNIPKIAAAAARRIAFAKTRLTLVPHDDEAGAAAMEQAGRLALDAGLRFGRTLLVAELVPDANDLNDAWRAGWRPQ
jgi:hypothetical protein